MAAREDLILVDGDPTVRMTDIHHIALVMKSGHIFDPAGIEKASGIAPRT
jgi:imidazolonepropionase-like amidohydrolase